MSHKNDKAQKGGQKVPGDDEGRRDREGGRRDNSRTRGTRRDGSRGRAEGHPEPPKNYKERNLNLRQPGVKVESRPPPDNPKPAGQQRQYKNQENGRGGKADKRGKIQSAKQDTKAYDSHIDDEEHRPSHNSISGTTQDYNRNVARGWEGKVLILSFAFNDLDLEDELEGVRGSFKDIGYEVDVYEIPMNDSLQELQRELQKWISSHQQSQKMISYIIYFSGHGGKEILEGKTRLLLSSHNKNTDKQELELYKNFIQALQRGLTEAMSEVIQQAPKASQGIKALGGSTKTNRAAKNVANKAKEATSAVIDDLTKEYKSEHRHLIEIRSTKVVHLRWSDIWASIVEVKADVLIILDICGGGLATTLDDLNADSSVQKSRYGKELISVGWETITYTSSKSIANALVRSLSAFQQNSTKSFSAETLSRSINKELAPHLNPSNTNSGSPAQVASRSLKRSERKITFPIPIRQPDPESDYFSEDEEE